MILKIIKLPDKKFLINDISYPIFIDLLILNFFSSKRKVYISKDPIDFQISL